MLNTISLFGRELVATKDLKFRENLHEKEPEFDEWFIETARPFKTNSKSYEIQENYIVFYIQRSIADRLKVFAKGQLFDKNDTQIVNNYDSLIDFFISCSYNITYDSGQEIRTAIREFIDRNK